MARRHNLSVVWSLFQFGSVLFWSCKLPGVDAEVNKTNTETKGSCAAEVDHFLIRSMDNNCEKFVFDYCALQAGPGVCSHAAFDV